MIADLSVTAQWALLWAVLVVGVALSALYSAMETGTYVLNKVRLDLRAEGGSRRARRLRDMLRDANNVLVVLLVGVNVANYAAAFAISAMFTMLGGSPQSVEWLTMLVATPLLFIFAESLPKNVMQRLGDRMMYRLAGLMWLSSLVYNAVGLAPAVRWCAGQLMKLAGQGSGRSPLGHPGFAAILSEGQASGVLTHIQSVMADRVMHIAQVKLSDVMIPMSRVTAASRSIARAQLMDLLRKQNYSRLPILETSGKVAGVLDLYDVLAGPEDVRPADKMVEPLVLPSTMPVTDGLYQMQRSRQTMAIIEGPGGKHIGIATVKDIVEEIVGELEVW